jgi:hypothetical protein
MTVSFRLLTILSYALVCASMDAFRGSGHERCSKRLARTMALDDRSADDAGRDDRHRVQVGGIARHDDPRRRTRHPPASATGSTSRIVVPSCRCLYLQTTRTHLALARPDNLYASSSRDTGGVQTHSRLMHARSGICEAGHVAEYLCGASRKYSIKFVN